MKKRLLENFCTPARKSNVLMSNFKTWIIALFVFVGFFNTQAQVSSYATTGSGVAQTYTALPAPVATGFGTAWDNNVSGLINLGFSFNFNSKPYTQCYISSNGFITFGAAPSPTNFNPISNNEGYEGAISGYGRDLKANGIDVLYQTQGLPGARTFTVQYTCLRSIGVTNAGPLNVQIILFETTNAIEIRYKAVTAIITANASLTGQVGLRGETNTDFRNRTYGVTGAWPTAAPVFANGTVNGASVLTRTSAATSISVNTTLNWSPPACLAPTKVKATPVSITNTSATITWTASTSLPASGYQYLVSTTAPNNMNNTGYPIAGTVQTGSVGAGVLTASVSGLTSSTLYYIYVRSNCGVAGGWSAAGTFTTLCNPFGDPFVTSVPYTQNFSSAVIPSFPACNSMENSVVAAPYPQGVWVTSAASVPDWGFPSQHARCLVSGGQDNFTTYFTQGITLTAGQSYRLSYTYGASSEFATTAQNLTVRYGTSPYDSAMLATPLADYVGFKNGPYTQVINFIPASSGTFFFGFKDTSEAANATVLLDDIDIRVTTCLAPTSLLAGSVSAYSAIISWVAPAAPPVGGYAYYYNTTGVPPTILTTPSGTTPAGTTLANLSALTPSSTYSFWIRSNCGSGDQSYWTLVPGTFTTPAAPIIPFPYCTPNQTSLPDGIGLTNVTLGTINNTTGLEPGGYGNYSTQVANVARGATVSVTLTYQTGFTYDSALFADWNNDGDFADAGEAYTLPSTVNADIPSIITGTFLVPIGAPLGLHRIRIGGQDSGPVLDPCRVGLYQVFEDYSVNVTPAPPAITLSSYTQTTCAGIATSTVSITSPLANYNSYSWSNAGSVSGTAPNYTFDPTSTTTYVLTGLNTTTFETTTVSFTSIENQPPTPITITPNAATICEGIAQALVATGGIVAGTPILYEGFNGASIPLGWTRTNITTGALSPAEADWTLRPSGYATNGNVIVSNDNTQFFLSNSDDVCLSSCGAVVTETTLTSKVFPLNAPGLVTASLSFWEYFRSIAGSDTTEILISTDPAPVPADATYFSLSGPATGSIGSQNNFSNTILDLTPYIGNATVHIRFKYNATWDWHWAIDNFLIQGDFTSAVSWTPTTGLYSSYTSPTVNTPYLGGGLGTVYAAPTSLTTYTATSSSGLGCTTTSTATITVIPRTGGTLTANQVVCNGFPANIVSNIDYTGAPGTGVILRWEYANDAAFSSGLTIVPASAGLTTILGSSIGTLIADRYYRMVVSVGGCPVVYSATHRITVPTATWTAGAWVGGITPDSTKKVTINGVLPAAQMPFSACSLIIGATGNVVVPSGVTITVVNDVKVAAGGILTFSNNASLLQTANPTIANSGYIKYIRNTTPVGKFDYTFWSSPVTPQVIGQVSTSTQPDKYYWWDASIGYYNWKQVATPSITPMTAGEGYIIRGPNIAPYDTTPTIFVANFGDGATNGVPNNGDYTHSIIVNGANDLNLLGNPYPSAMSANLLMSGNTATLGALGVGTTFYFWTHNTPPALLNYVFNDYALYNLTGGTRAAVNSGVNNSIPTGNIAAAQSFFVKGVNSGTLTYRNSMRLSGLNTQFYRLNSQANSDPFENIERHRLWLDLKNDSGAFKEILVGYIENATNNFENGLDGEAIEAGNVISLYSIADAKNMTIQGRALPFDVNDQVLLGYKITTAGTYQIDLSLNDGMFTDTSVAVYLHDTLLNVYHNLRDGAYSFVTEPGTFNTRFVLQYTNPTLGTTNPIFNENAVIVYKNNSTITVETSNFQMQSVKVFDINGREIISKSGISTNKVELTPLSVAKQVLLVQVTSIDGVQVNKKIVY
jgi:GEVED domain